jgi:ApaG protein
MESLTTQGIKISVESFYESQHSNPDMRKFVFSYKVTIENDSAFEVQLLSRHWIITDAGLNIKEVNGEGIVGEQPVLTPGSYHSYSSWCPLETEVGKMEGSYTMKRLTDGKLFEATIPAFRLIASYIEN